VIGVFKVPSSRGSCTIIYRLQTFMERSKDKISKKTPNPKCRLFGRWTNEKVKGSLVHKRGWKTNMIDSL
jgi:hypothetical protein